MFDLMHGLKPVYSEVCACKICGGEAPLYGVVDFHRACEIPNGAHLSLSGVPIYYRRCEHCGFLFTDAFNNWDMKQFQTHIYNNEYELVDPEYETKRPRENADCIVRYWGAIKERARILDYGGGNGMLSAMLRENGFQTAVTYDPMVRAFSGRPE